MFDALADRFEGIFKKLRSRGKLTDKEIDEVARELRVALLEADVNVVVARNFIARVKERARGADVTKSLSPAQQVIKIVNEELVQTLGGTTGKLTVSSKPPSVVMMAGLQGSGKTTASAKLAKHLVGQGRRPLLVGADLQRPAAVEQLRVLGERAGVPVFSEPTDPVAVARGGLEEAARLGRDVVIVDTAGRLQVDVELMDELREVRDAVQPQRHAARRRRDDRAGSGQRRDRVRPGRRAQRRGAHQDRRRRAWRRRALGEGGGREAHPLRRYRREARRLRAVPSRPDGEPHPRDGRRAHADREGRGRRSTSRRWSRPRRSSARASSRSRTSSTRCARSRRWARSRTSSGLAGASSRSAPSPASRRSPRLLDEGEHVAHAEDASRHAIGVEQLEVFEFSPVTRRVGLPTTSFTDRAAPPRASPSIW